MLTFLILQSDNLNPGVMRVLLSARTAEVIDRIRRASEVRVSVYELLEFRHLKYIIAVAETGTFIAAAAKLHVSQSAISTQIGARREPRNSNLRPRAQNDSHNGRQDLAEVWS